jgi:hypothetical protein
VSKMLTAIAKDPRVACAYRDSDGVWIEMKRGWTVDPRDAHDIHELTVTAAKARMKDIVVCECDNCQL